MIDHPWQDIIFSTGNIIFTFGLLASILSDRKPAKWTGLLSASVFSVFSFSYVTLGLSFAATAAGVNAVCWWILFFQEMRREMLKKQEEQAR